MKKWLICSILVLLILSGCQREISGPEEGRTINYYFAVDTLNNPWADRSIDILNSLVEIHFYIDSIQRVNSISLVSLPTLIINKEITLAQFYLRDETVNTPPAFSITDTSALDLNIWIKSQDTSIIGYAVDTFGDTLNLYFSENPVKTFFNIYLLSETNSFGMPVIFYRSRDSLVINTYGDYLVPLKE